MLRLLRLLYRLCLRGLSRLNRLSCLSICRRRLSLLLNLLTWLSLLYLLRLLSLYGLPGRLRLRDLSYRQTLLIRFGWNGSCHGGSSIHDRSRWRRQQTLNTVYQLGGVRRENVVDEQNIGSSHVLDILERILAEIADINDV